jgi:hypothetical protein
MSFSSPAERIRALIDNARHSAAAAGRHIDLNQVYVRALIRCGIGHAEASAVLAAGHDPVGRILHFAGDTHNFAILAVEEALAAA